MTENIEKVENKETIAESVSVEAIKAVEVSEVKSEDVVIETSEKNKVIPLKITYDDIFVTEDDTFDVEINFSKDGNKLVVENVDNDFSKDSQHASINITFKYPSQGDVARISNDVSKNIAKNIEQMDIASFNLLEVSRMLCLIRKWSIDKKLDNSAIMELNPKIVKSVIYKIRTIIGNDGIF